MWSQVRCFPQPEHADPVSEGSRGSISPAFRDQIFLRVSELPMRISAIAGIELALYLTVSVFLLPLLLVAQF